MANIALNDHQWLKIKSFLQTQEHLYIGKDEDCRIFLEALVWIVRSGAQWRLLPKRYGNWNTIYKRFARWEKQGIFKAMIEHFAGDPHLKNLMLDSTIIRAHPCAAGALKKRRTGKPSPRAFPWRLQHEDPCFGRGPRQTHQVSSHRGSTP